MTRASPSTPPEMLGRLIDTSPNSSLDPIDFVRACLDGLRVASELVFERLCCAPAGGGAAASKVAFGTEAGLFAVRGIASVVCGPGDMTRAHKPDESVARAELERCAGFLRGLVDRAVAA